MKQKKLLSMLALIIAAALVCSIIMGFLYRYDNKYTHKGTQPIAGMLILDHQILQQEQVFYLTRGWSFYPGKLLTPKDFADGRMPDTYMQTITIGRTNHFPQRCKTAWTGGSASYHLTLSLPAEERAYTLLLPEIYSAFRLYLNDTEVLSMGTPEEDGFTEQIANRSITFSAGGQTELLLAVTNRSHFSDGLTYPPVFGLPEAVGRTDTTGLLLRVIAFLFALFCTVLSLYLTLAFRGKREPRVILFLLTSLCIALTYLYPLLFHYLVVAPKPWYGIELLGIYGSSLFAVMLQNEICDMDTMPKKLSTTVLAVFTGAALCYGLLPAYPLWLTSLFGGAATAVKLLTIGYLLICAVYAALHEQENSRLLLFCTTAFGISIVFDRLCSAWEPILGGWPTEYGCAVLLVGFGMVLWRDLSEGYRLKLTFTEEKRQLTRQVAIQKAHYMELTDKIEDAIRMRHDERHHLQTLYGIYESKDYERLGKYLSDYVLTSMPKQQTVLCKNLIADGMLRYYEALCEQEHIRFSCTARLTPELPIPDVELSILFGNLLENAYEAAKQPGCQEPFVSFQVMVEHDSLFLLIQNSFVNPIRQKGSRFLSTKHEGYGVGTRSACSVAENHGGTCTFEHKDGVFIVSVIFALKG